MCFCSVMYKYIGTAIRDAYSVLYTYLSFYQKWLAVIALRKDMSLAQGLLVLLRRDQTALESHFDHLSFFVRFRVGSPRIHNKCAGKVSDKFGSRESSCPT